MLKTQNLIVFIGTNALIAQCRAEIIGFKAFTHVPNITDDNLKSVYHFNKNAIHFMPNYDIALAKYHPVVIQLVNGKTDFDKNFLSASTIQEDLPKLLKQTNIDCGDHMSHDSKGVHHSPDKCLMCKIVNGTAPKSEHILFESDHFIVVPGTGAFFDGYIMIVPKRHIMSFANCTPEEFDEFLVVYSQITSILSQIYHKPVFGFECSSGKTGEGKHETSIVHAHFHLSVTEMPVLSEVLASGLTPALIRKETLSDYDLDPYMLYVDNNDQWYICCDKREYYPRQHPRQVLAQWMAVNDRRTLHHTLKSVMSDMSLDEKRAFIESEAFYNWRYYDLRCRMDEIADEFRTWCSANKNVLPKFMQNAIRYVDH